MSAEPQRSCPSCGNALSGVMESCPVCMLREALASDVESGESSSEDTLKPISQDAAHRFEHYQLVKGEDGNPVELGRGAMGVTYKAFDVDLQCPVALKVIREKFLGDESARLRFLREARAAARLRHSNVASVLHLGRTGKNYFYAMEFVEGETLENLIRRSGELEAKLALEIATQVAAGLTAVHKQKLVHRDIKPSNIMVSLEDGGAVTAKIIDLGMAKPAPDAPAETAISTLGAFAGTPTFASPEQFAGVGVDIRSDLYSLGVVLWEMVTGHAVFRGSQAEVMYQHQHASLPLEDLEHVPQPVFVLLEVLLEKDPARRFQNPAELLKAMPTVTSAIDAGRSVTRQSLRETPLAASRAVTREPPTRLGPEKICTARLPITGSDVFGREDDIAFLDDAWANQEVNVVTIVAWAGVGKSTLVNHWLRRMAAEHYRSAQLVFGWSFYGQGSSRGTSSADEFFNAALTWFGDPDPRFETACEKGERLAKLIADRRTLLILDGLEPVQNPPSPQEGRVREPSLQALLRGLAAFNAGLCVITTRIPVTDTADHEGTSALRRDLEQLSSDAGAKLLRALGVKGDEVELRSASDEFSGHCLALTLLGCYLTDAYNGDVRCREEVSKRLAHDVRQGVHARKVMESYENWFWEGPELSVLRILGLFDRPVDEKALGALLNPPAIRGLTGSLANLSPAEWRTILAKLRRARLLSGEDPQNPGQLDTHPLVREYFGEQLRRHRTEAWKEGNKRLYDYYRALAPPLPDSFIDMEPHTLELGPEPGSLLKNRYRLIEDVNPENRGRIFHAEDTLTRMRVTVRIFLADPAILAQIDEEAERIKGSPHPNFIQLFAIERERNIGFIVLEWLEGFPLVDLLRARRALTLREMLMLLQQIAPAVDAAREPHLSLEMRLPDIFLHFPESFAEPLANIVLRCPLDEWPAFVVKMSLLEKIKGLEASAGPVEEQTKISDLKPQRDVVQLGIVAYELLGGKPGGFAPLANVSEKCNEVLRKCLTPDRSFSTAAEFYDSLRGVANAKSEPVVSVTRQPKPERLTPPRHEASTGTNAGAVPAQSVPASNPIPDSKNHFWPIAGALIAILLAIGAVWIFLPAILNPTPNHEPQVLTETRSQKTNAAFGSHPPVQPEKPWTNSLEMRFVPLGDIYISVWQTRKRDFETFVQATGYDAVGGMSSAVTQNGFKLNGMSWRAPGFQQTPDHPVVGVSWEDANQFCAWLTKKERKEGKLTTVQSYRLPTDREWSRAVGLEHEEGNTPEELSGKIKAVYPWGDTFPPPNDSGNYAGSESRVNTLETWSVIPGFHDAFPRTAPVSAFKSNARGLCCIGSNVWEWCMDKFENTMNWRTLRGGSWATSRAEEMLSSYRRGYGPLFRCDDVGFRCVIAGDGAHE